MLREEEAVGIWEDWGDFSEEEILSLKNEKGIDEQKRGKRKLHWGERKDFSYSLVVYIVRCFCKTKVTSPVP